MTHPYFPLLVLFGFAAVIVVALLIIAQNVGPKSYSPVKGEPFESGNPPRGDARIRFSVQFYLVAMLFLIFDLEVVFLYPWAVVYKDYIARGLGSAAFWSMVFFLGLIFVGFAYLWRFGYLDWVRAVSPTESKEESANHGVD